MGEKVLTKVYSPMFGMLILTQLEKNTTLNNLNLKKVCIIATVQIKSVLTTSTCILTKTNKHCTVIFLQKVNT